MLMNSSQNVLSEPISPYHVEKLPFEERPREKLKHFGAEALSVIELIAVIFGSGTKEKPVLQVAQDLAMKFENVQKIAEASVEELCSIKGLGMAKALQLKAAFQLGLRLSRREALPKMRVDHPLQAYHLVKERIEAETREHLITILIDVRGYVISYHVISVGTLSHTLVHPREVFHPAIRHKASSIILVHNHPSGDPHPSTEDYDITKALMAAGQLLQIPIYDHIIIGRSDFISMRQQGFLFF